MRPLETRATKATLIIYNSARLLAGDVKPNGSFALAGLFHAPGSGFIVSGNSR